MAKKEGHSIVLEKAANLGYWNFTSYFSDGIPLWRVRQLAAMAPIRL